VLNDTVLSKMFKFSQIPIFGDVQRDSHHVHPVLLQHLSLKLETIVSSGQDLPVINIHLGSFVNLIVLALSQLFRLLHQVFLLLGLLLVVHPVLRLYFYSLLSGSVFAH